jgi:hypothetical protein
MRRTSTTQLHGSGKITARKSPKSYESNGIYLPSLNGQRASDTKLNDVISYYQSKDEGGWFKVNINGKELEYQIVNIPCEQLVTWTQNPRHTLADINEVIERGGRADYSHLTKEQSIDESKKQSVRLMLNSQNHPLCVGMLRSGGPTDAVDVVMRDDELFDVVEGNRRTAVSHFLIGFLDQCEGIESLPKAFLKKIESLKLRNAYPAEIPCKVWRGATLDDIQFLLAIYHGNAKLRWTPFTQAKAMLDSFQSGHRPDLHAQGLDLSQTPAGGPERKVRTSRS